MRKTRSTPSVALSLAISAAAGNTNAADLKNFITDLYGGDGIVLPIGIIGGVFHQPHFVSDSQAQLNNLNSGVVGGLNSFSLNSTTGAITFDVATGVPVKSEDGLGPLLVERAQTLGQGKLNIGFGYSHTGYDSFEGDELENLHLTFDHEDSVPGVDLPFELDTVEVDIDAQLDFDVYAFYGNFGVTDRWDVGIILPIVSVEARASAFATISGPTDIHNFPTGPIVPGTDGPTSVTGGEDTGIGDVVFRTKYSFLRDRAGAPDVSALAQVTVPTGDEDQLLGTGETKVKALLIASKSLGVFNPHVNFGYETSSGEDEEDNLAYAAGFDTTVMPSLALGADILGRWYPDQDKISNHLVDFAVSAKWNPVKGRSLPINAFIIVPINSDDGLRSDLAYGVGIDYVF